MHLVYMSPDILCMMITGPINRCMEIMDVLDVFSRFHNDVIIEYPHDLPKNPKNDPQPPGATKISSIFLGYGNPTTFQRIIMNQLSIIKLKCLLPSIHIY